MAGRPQKPAVLIFSFLLFVFTVSAVTFNVNVEGDKEASVYETDYLENISKYQKVNLTAENTGSIGCSFQLKGSFFYGNSTDRVYSPSRDLWPGESGLLRIDYLPINYTGKVYTELSLSYCDSQKFLGNFTFNVEKNTTVEKNVESTTVSAAPEKAEIKTEEEEAVLVPSEGPDGWKVASARIKDGKAELDYKPTLFDSSREIKYTVLNKTTGEPIGETTVKLEAEDAWLDLLKENRWKILLIFSALVNLFLLNRRRIRSAAERFKGYKDKLRNR